jgi:hypothetical protein
MDEDSRNKRLVALGNAILYTGVSHEEAFSIRAM